MTPYNDLPDEVKNEISQRQWTYTPNKAQVLNDMFTPDIEDDMDVNEWGYWEVSI